LSSPGVAFFGVAFFGVGAFVGGFAGAVTFGAAVAENT